MLSASAGCLKRKGMKKEKYAQNKLYQLDISNTVFLISTLQSPKHTLGYYFGDYSDPDQETAVHLGVMLHCPAALRKPSLCCAAFEPVLWHTTHLARRTNSTSSLSQRIQQAAPRRRLHHAHGLAVILKCSKSFSCEQPL